MLDKFAKILTKVHNRNFSEQDIIDKKYIAEFSKRVQIDKPKEKARPNGNHSVIFGTKSGKPMVLKTVSNPSFASRTLTEIYTLIQLDGKLDKEFRTPKILDFGFTDDKFLWFITDRVSENYLKGNSKKDIDILSKATVSVIRSGLKVPLKDEKRLESIENGDAYKLLKKLDDIALEWSKEFSDNIDDLVDIMNEYPINELPPVTVHGDLVARHLVDLGKDKYQIYDWELTGGAWFWGYEPAYVYHRTYTRDGSPKLAEIYLENLFESMDAKEKKYLIKSFKSMLAQRIIGGYKDYSGNSSTEYHKNKSLHRDVMEFSMLPHNLA